MDVNKADHVGTLVSTYFTLQSCITHIVSQQSHSDSSSGATLPAPQAVLDALVALSPRKNEGKVNLAPISVSQFESYTMDEQPTPVAFSFNVSLLSTLSYKMSG